MRRSFLSSHLPNLARSDHQRCIARTLSSSATRHSARSSESQSADANEQDEPEPGQAPRRTGVSFEAWLAKIGEQFKSPLTGRTNWLGVTHPFPMNPSFKPRAPIANSLRKIIFESHISAPEENTVRVLSERFGISMKRIEAIIQLKSVEMSWIQQGRPPRINFMKGMESALGVTQYHPNALTNLQQQSLSSPAHKADMAAERDASTVTEVQSRLPKIYWEGVEDGKEPLVAPLLASLADQHAQKIADQMAAQAKFLASHQHVVPPTKEGRAPIVFVDVGRKFMVAKDVKKREKAAQARRNLKEKKKLRAR